MTSWTSTFVGRAGLSINLATSSGEWMKLLMILEMGVAVGIMMLLFLLPILLCFLDSWVGAGTNGMIFGSLV